MSICQSIIVMSIVLNEIVNTVSRLWCLLTPNEAFFSSKSAITVPERTLQDSRMEKLQTHALGWSLSNR